MESIAGCAHDVNTQYRRHVQNVFREVNTLYLDVYSSDEDSSKEESDHITTEDITQKEREKADTPPPPACEGDKCERLNSK